MAVSVDEVYKTVLLILNKEQRGYMTPNEFNKIGSQVQREIYERYFEDLAQQARVPQGTYDITMDGITDLEYTDRLMMTDEKLSVFKTAKPLFLSFVRFTSGGEPSDIEKFSLRKALCSIWPSVFPTTIIRFPGFFVFIFRIFFILLNTPIPPITGVGDIPLELVSL